MKKLIDSIEGKASQVACRRGKQTCGKDHWLMLGLCRTQQIVRCAQDWLEDTSKKTPHLRTLLSLGSLPCTSMLVLDRLVR